MTSPRLAPGATDVAVRDLQRRLTSAGHAVGSDTAGWYGSGTEQAVRTFQADRGLEVDGVCGPHTWAALVESGFELGDRLLYLHAPMLRGDDVHQLQLALSALGFHRGRVDGIFGPETRDAASEFQRNVGLSPDGVVGPDTISAMRRLGRRPGTSVPVAVVLEQRHHEDGPRTLAGVRMLLADAGGAAVLAGSLARTLRDRSAVVLTLTHPDGSVMASTANRFGADVFLAFELSDHDECAVRFFATEGFESPAGRLLADLIDERLHQRSTLSEGVVEGKRLPALRETRMPAVTVRLGPAVLVTSHPTDLVAALVEAIEDWLRAAYPQV